MSRKRHVFKCHVRFTTLVPLIFAQSLLNLPSFCLFVGIFYCVFSADFRVWREGWNPQSYFKTQIHDG